MRGQFSTEFLVVVSFMLILFVLVIFIYFMQVNETDQSADYLEATRICLHTSSMINSFIAMRGNSTYTFDLAPTINLRNYTIWIISNLSHMQVTYQNRSVGCPLLTKNITNATGSTFFTMQKNATLRGYYGVLTVE